MADRPPDSYLFSLRYLVPVNLMTCGLELCTSAAFGYLPPLLLEEGISETSMGLVMAIGPMIALLLVPLMGTMSDNCTSRYGRRRPFLAVLAVLTFVSMIALACPSSLFRFGSFGGYLVTPERAKFLVLAVSIVTFDLCTQMSFTPMESLLADPCHSDRHHNKSFVVFTFLLSVGACVGYLLLSVDWGATTLGSALGGQRQSIFLILSVMFVLFTWISLSTAYDPQVTKPARNSSESLDHNHHRIHDSHNHENPTVLVNGVIPEFDSSLPIRSKASHVASPDQSDSTAPTIFSVWTPMGCCMSVCRVVSPRRLLGLFTLMAQTVGDTFTGLWTMPRALRRLWLANLLSNTAVIGFRLYFTDYVGEALYKGNPDSLENSAERNLYDTGVRMGSWGLFLHSVVSGLTSIFFERILLCLGERGVFLYGMLLFTIMAGLMLFIENLSLTIILAAGTGIGMAITSTVPYTLLSGYHENSALYFSDLEPQHAHLHGKGADFSLLDSGIILSEIVAPLFFGTMVGYTRSTSSHIACATVFGAISCISVWWIDHPSLPAFKGAIS